MVVGFLKIGCHRNDNLATLDEEEIKQKKAMLFGVLLAVAFKSFYYL